MTWLLKLDRTPRLIIFSILLGVIGALGAQLFLLLLHWADVYILGAIGNYQAIDVATAHAAGSPPEPFSKWYWWVPVATTLGGLVAGVLIYWLAPETEGHGTDAALSAFHGGGGRMRTRVPFVKAVVSAITIGSGGSGGREGPTAQIASGAGAILAGWLKLSDEERRTIVLIGMAAGLSAIFKSPLGTAIFAVEILYSRMAFEGGALIYTLISAAVAYAITGIFSGFTPLFLLPESGHALDPANLIWFALLGIIAGGFGVLLPAVFYRVRDAFRALKIPNHFKPAIGGLAVGLIGIAVPPIIGGGYGYMQFVLQGGTGLLLWVLLLFAVGKIVTLSLTVGSGGAGGLFGPTLYVGAMLGAAFAALLQVFNLSVDSSWLAVVGMAAVFAGAARVPIASMVMVIEMTGGFQLIMPTMIAVALAFIVQMALSRRARYPTLYEAQVPMPIDSPANRQMYRNSVQALLRRHELELDCDVLNEELQSSLASDAGVALGGAERLYHVPLAAGTPVAGRTIAGLNLDDMNCLIAGIIRGESEIVPHRDTRLQVGDVLLVAAEGDAIDRFRALIAAHATAKNLRSA